MVFLAQKLIYTVNIQFNFAFGLFFEHDHLLNLIILGVYAKQMFTYFKTEIDIAQNLIDDFFSNFDRQRIFL